MPRLVPDAGVLAVALVDDGSHGDRVRGRLLGNDLFAPELIDLEVVAVIRKQVLRGSLSADRAAQAIDDLTSLPLSRVPHRALVRRAWHLHENVTPYDASYIAVAERLDATLVTADVRLTKAPGLNCAVEMLTG